MYRLGKYTVFAAAAGGIAAEILTRYRFFYLRADFVRSQPF